MFYHLQYIHLFRPFLKYTPAASPLPAHVSPRRICTANAGAISKLMRLYKKTYNLRQICNIAVYMIHSACTIHMLNLPEKTAKRDVIHGIKHLEEIAEDWLCARRTLCIISVLARKWNVEMPEEAAVVLQRADEKYGTFSTSDVPSPNRSSTSITPSPPTFPISPSHQPEQFSPLHQYSQPTSPRLEMSLDDPGAGMSPDLLNSLAMSGPPQQSVQSVQPQLRDQQMTRLVSGPTISMSSALSAANSWASMPAVAQPITSYAQPSFPALHQTVGRGGNNAGSAGARHVSPASVYAIDAQDWYLKDGVNWQQNFEAWSMGANTSAGPAVSNPGGTPGVSSAGTMRGVSSPMFMFQGLQGTEMEPAAFDGFGSMGSLDNLPGLD